MGSANRQSVIPKIDSTLLSILLVSAIGVLGGQLVCAAPQGSRCPLDGHVETTQHAVEDLDSSPMVTVWPADRFGPAKAKRTQRGH